MQVIFQTSRFATFDYNTHSCPKQISGKAAQPSSQRGGDWGSGGLPPANKSANGLRRLCRWSPSRTARDMNWSREKRYRYNLFLLIILLFNMPNLFIMHILLLFAVINNFFVELKQRSDAFIIRCGTLNSISIFYGAIKAKMRLLKQIWHCILII